MEPSTLQRYRRDRRQLLGFILSSDLVSEVRGTRGASTSISGDDLDALSADYVIHTVKSGGVLDMTEGTRKYYDESSYPVTIQSNLGDSYFCVSNPESAGSPPRRMPPSVIMKKTDNVVGSSNFLGPTLDQNVARGVKYADNMTAASEPLKSLSVPLLGLPSLTTGLSDDDLRESAYEILLASMTFSGLDIHVTEDKGKERGSKFLSRLKSKRHSEPLQSQFPEKHLGLIDTIRAQMQISGALDLCTRQRLMHLVSTKTSERIDIPQISLGLLNGMSNYDFSNEKAYAQWKKRQANILEELLCLANNRTSGDRKVRSLLAKVKTPKDWALMPPSQQAEVLSAINEVLSVRSYASAAFGIHGETYYWTAGYHLNIRLYEKLLFSVFDILEEGQLVEEADEILKLIKLTWSILGINQRLHNALYGWVLFKQFVGTDEGVLLDCAILEMQKVISDDKHDEKEEQYMNSLSCSTVYNGRELKLSVLQALFLSMSIWCENKLQFYHLYFHQKPCFFKEVVTLALAVWSYAFDESGEVKFTKSNSSVEVTNRRFRTYVVMSIKKAYLQVASAIDLKSKVEKKHPLALLANELRLIVERELNVFGPVLHQHYPEAGMVSAMLLHNSYGEKLKPFLEGVSCLSEDVRLVLSAANKLEQDLRRLYFSSQDNVLHSSCGLQLNHYQIGEVSGPIILEWIIAQHERIVDWTGRVFDLEEWEPISNQKMQARSAVEVFRILEETVDQFFGLNLPMEISHLRALLSIMFHTLDVYVLKVSNQIVDKHHLYPPVPSLTRYEEVAFPVMKKKLGGCSVLEEGMIHKLNTLSTSTLCVRLNTLQYIQKQVDTLEDGIRKSWPLVRTFRNQSWSKETYSDITEGLDRASVELVDELFAANFDSIKDTASGTIRKICAFTGARVVFWDLRDSFLFHLYRGSVESARLDGVLPYFDSVLKKMCDVIDESLRDLVVSSICRSSMEGFVWVLLDGGPSRAFSVSDIGMLEDDLNILKELLIAEGEGLPRSLVEKEASFAHQVLDLFSLQTNSVIQMLMSASEYISVVQDSSKDGTRRLDDAHTLLRVLCHKKDKEASSFLKRHYQLPASSEYDDGPVGDSDTRSPFVSDVLMRNASVRWSENGSRRFRSIKKKLMEATS